MQGPLGSKLACFGCRKPIFQSEWFLSPRQRGEGDSGNSGTEVGDPRCPGVCTEGNVYTASSPTRPTAPPLGDTDTSGKQNPTVTSHPCALSPLHGDHLHAHHTWGPGHGSRSHTAVWCSGCWAGETRLQASRLPPSPLHSPSPTPPSASPSLERHRFPATSLWKVLEHPTAASWPSDRGESPRHGLAFPPAQRDGGVGRCLPNSLGA